MKYAIFGVLMLIIGGIAAHFLLPAANRDEVASVVVNGFPTQAFSENLVTVDQAHTVIWKRTPKRIVGVPLGSPAVVADAWVATAFYGVDGGADWNWELDKVGETIDTPYVTINGVAPDLKLITIGDRRVVNKRSLNVSASIREEDLFNAIDFKKSDLERCVAAQTLFTAAVLEQAKLSVQQKVRNILQQANRDLKMLRVHLVFANEDELRDEIQKRANKDDHEHCQTWFEDAQE